MCEGEKDETQAQCMCVCICRCPWRPEESVRSPGAGVTSGCEPPDMHIRNQTLVPWQWQVLLTTELSLSRSTIAILMWQRATVASVGNGLPSEEHNAFILGLLTVFLVPFVQSQGSVWLSTGVLDDTWHKYSWVWSGEDCVCFQSHFFLWSNSAWSFIILKMSLYRLQGFS